jgi:hypothetical protein
MRPLANPAVTEREPPADSDVTEIWLLLPSRQATALKEVARQRGLTLARVLRGLIQEYLRQSVEQRNR